MLPLHYLRSNNINIMVGLDPPPAPEGGPAVAPAVEAPAPGGGALGGAAPVGAPVQAEPLEDMLDLTAAVQEIANDTAPLVNVLKDMSDKIDTLQEDRRFTRLENRHLLLAARKAKLAALTAKLTNPLSIRAVTFNAKLDNMVQDMLGVIKGNGQRDDDSN